MESSRVLALYEIIGEDVASVSVKIPGLKRSWIEVKAFTMWQGQSSWRELRKATGESVVQLRQETPAFGCCGYCGMTIKDSCRHGGELAWACETSWVCRGWQSPRSSACCPDPLEPRGSRCQTLDFFIMLKSDLLWFNCVTTFILLSWSKELFNLCFDFTATNYYETLDILKKLCKFRGNLDVFKRLNFESVWIFKCCRTYKV